MKVAVIGTRGFPGVQGGVEAHCQNLYTRLASMGYDIVVFTRKQYVNPDIEIYEKVRLVPISCPRTKSFEAFVHTLKGIFEARKINPDLLHIHSIGPSLLVPLAKLLRLKVVMTNHGPDYKRRKWGIFAKLVLRFGEMLGSCFANEVICISKTIVSDIKRKYKRHAHFIPNGIEIAKILKSDEILKKHSLTKKKYVLAVGRFVPEKGLHDLIIAFNAALLKGWKLVIAGDADHEDRYSRNLRERAQKSQHVILTGLLSGKPLQELFSHAGLLALPSYYEGLPITLLEGLNYGLLCIASDIQANRHLSLPDENYFQPSNPLQLSKKLNEFAGKALSQEERNKQIQKVRQEYNWDHIARQTLQVYAKIDSG